MYSENQLSAPVLLRAARLQESLATLHLDVTRGSRGVLSAVAHLTRLQKLEVLFYDWEDLEFTQAEMLSLRSLSQLREVVVASEFH
jgi:hypothetical protein